MADIAFSVPIKPGKTEAWEAFTKELTGARAAEVDAMMQKAGVTATRTWLQHTPDGDAAVVLHEGPNAHKFLETVSQMDDPTAAWFREAVNDIHGLDFDGPLPPAPRPMLNVEHA